MRAYSVFSAALIGLLLALSSVSAANAAPGDWAAPVDVSAGERGLAPQLATTANGTVTASWQEFVGGRTALFVASSTDDGVTWSAKQQLSTGTAWVSTQVMATLGNDTITIAWLQNDLITSTSLDGGATWSMPAVLVGSGTGPTWHQLTSAGDHLVLGWSELSGPNYVPMASASADGLAWSTPVVVPSPANEDVTAVTLAASGPAATMTFTSYIGSNRRIVSSSSTDGGLTWGSSVTIASSQQSMYLAGLVIAPTHSLTAIWQQYDGVAYHLSASTSTNAGATWSAPAALGNAGNGATIAVSSTGTLVAGWGDGSTNRSMVSTSTDGGQTWGAARTVSAIGTTAFGLTLAIENDATINAIIFGLIGNTYVIQAAESVDQGATWTVPVIISQNDVEGLPTTATSARALFVTWQGTPLEVITQEAAIAAAITTPAALAATGAEPLPWLLTGLLLVAVGVGALRRRSERA